MICRIISTNNKTEKKQLDFSSQIFELPPGSSDWGQK